MNMLKNKFIRFAVSMAVVSICGFGTFYLLSASKVSPQVSEIKQQKDELSQVSLPSLASANSQKPADIDTSKPIVRDGKSYMLMSPTEMLDLNNWMSNKGYFEKSDIDVYASYSEETLKELAKKGDLVALNVLTTKLVNSGNEKEATFYMNLAAIYGSTTALDNLTIYTSPRYTDNATEEQRRPAVLETLAVTKLMALRGDRSLSNVSRNSFTKSYKQLYDVDIALSPEEQQFVDYRAQEIYDKFQEIRIAKGLGDFDNSEPSGMKKFFGMQ